MLSLNVEDRRRSAGLAVLRNPPDCAARAARTKKSRVFAARVHLLDEALRHENLQGPMSAGLGDPAG
jgi:hypothetical protein